MNQIKSCRCIFCWFCSFEYLCLILC